MTNPNLSSYISQSKASGITDNVIKSQLIKSGWPVGEVEEAFLPVSTTPVPPVPPPAVPRFSMWINFQYVLLFITLWVWSISLGGIWHYAINKHIPDSLAKNGYDYLSMYSTSLLRGYLAAIIVAFPFFALFFISLKRQIEKNPAIKNIKTRKFLFYFTIIVNFLYMLGQLIGTLLGFLSATISSRTVPNLLVNLIIPGAICIYLLTEVREDRSTSI